MASGGGSPDGAHARHAARSYRSVRRRRLQQQHKPLAYARDHDRKGCVVHWIDAYRRGAFFSVAALACGKNGSRELFTLAVIALALGVAFGSAKLFGVSFALGAFFAGVVVNESDQSHRASRDLQPLQDAFTVLFFVAVGMLFDPSILVREPVQVIAVLDIVVLGNALAAFGVVRLLRGSY